MNGDNRICSLFGITNPIVQAGMVWCSGWRLASSVSNAGGLGLIGSGSMHPELLRDHIQKCKEATTRPFGVNVPLLYPEVDKIMDIIKAEEIRIVFTSAGNPREWTPFLKGLGVTVVHVVSSVKFAVKAMQAGVDAIVAEGFEAGGHNGREETTTLVLVPLVRQAVPIPLLAAGGIASGRAMLATEILGADGVQIGSRFAASVESSAHENFKRKITASGEGDTMLTLKQLTPVRMIKNSFFRAVEKAELRGADKSELKMLLGERRSKRGIFEGDLDEGELEIGQISAGIAEIKPAAVIVDEIMREYRLARTQMCQ
jgi:enoyl-[acyl-carrier protein] reductase II